jgi:hypothetical protein
LKIPTCLIVSLLLFSGCSASVRGDRVALRKPIAPEMHERYARNAGLIIEATLLEAITLDHDATASHSFYDLALTFQMDRLLHGEYPEPQFTLEMQEVHEKMHSGWQGSFFVPAGNVHAPNPRPVGKRYRMYFDGATPEGSGRVDILLVQIAGGR